MKRRRFTSIKRNSGVIYFELYAVLMIAIIISVCVTAVVNVNLNDVIVFEVMVLISLIAITFVNNQRLYTFYTFRKFIASRKELLPVWEGELAWPKIYFKINHEKNQRIFFIKNDGSTSSQLLLNSIDSLANAFKTVLTGTDPERDGIYVYMELEKIPQEDTWMANVNSTQKAVVRICQGIEWRPLENPHGIIVGRTGSGKSVLAQMIIRCLADSFTIYYLDPKNSYKTKKSLEGLGVKYCSTATDIIDTLQSLNKEMIQRGKDIEQLCFMKDDLLKYDFSKILIVFDEMGAVGDMPDMPKNGHSEIIKAVRSIMLQGREMNFQILALCQRADS